MKSLCEAPWITGSSPVMTGCCRCGRKNSDILLAGDDNHSMIKEIMLV
jgi:hypothetical protein